MWRPHPLSAVGWCLGITQDHPQQGEPGDTWPRSTASQAAGGAPSEPETFCPSTASRWLTARACRSLDCQALADRPCGKGPGLHRPGVASAVRSTCLQARVGQPRERRGPSSCHHAHRGSPFPG
jgi:hypothetical protein